jgi:acetyl esterase/lipase
MTPLFTVQLLRFLFLIFCVAIGAIVSGETQPTPPRSMREMVMMPVVYRIAGMDKVTVKSNLKYTEVNNPDLLMDVYHPPNLAKNERRPVVLFIHGGAGAETTPKDWAFTHPGEDWLRPQA